MKYALLLWLVVSSVLFFSCDNNQVLTDAQALAQDTNNLTIGYRQPDTYQSVTKNLKLDQSGSKGSSITWHSDKEDVITIAGFVMRPSAVDSVVTLTATLTKGVLQDTKTFVVTVVHFPVVVGEAGPAGGIVFYDKGSYSDGWRYLEAAPSGWYNTTEDPSFVWGGYGTSVSTAEGIGTGKANTLAIVTAFGNAEPYEQITLYAAKICDTALINDHDDWFLPSYTELNKMYEVLHKNDKGDFLDSSDTYYWSSSQTAVAEGAWTQRFDLEHKMSKPKDVELPVRPIRAF